MELPTSHESGHVYDPTDAKANALRDSRPIIIGSLDLEMSCLNSDIGGILQIGLWMTGQSEGVLRGYYRCDVNPENMGFGRPKRKIVYDKKSMEVNGITPELIRTGVSVPDALMGLLGEMSRYRGSRIVLVGAGIGSDMEWLEKMLWVFGYTLPSFELVEIKDLTKKALGEEMGLNKAASRVGVKNSNAHDALADAWCGAVTAHRLGALIRERGGEPW